MRPCIVDVMGLDGLAGLDCLLFFCLILPPLIQQAIVTDPLNLTFSSLFARHAIQFKEA